MSITEFLLARIAEDEAVARAASVNTDKWRRNGTWWLEGVEHEVIGDEEAFCHPHNADHIARHDPARVLAECAAKRAVVDVYTTTTKTQGTLAVKGMETACEIVVKCLAEVYSDHPEYRDEWRVGV